MKLYQFPGTGEIKIFEKEKETEIGVKVKVSKVLPTPYDHNLFNGKIKTDYPITPCSMATAIISEDNDELMLKRGQKVILNPYYKTKENGNSIEMYSKNKDGFFRDFITLPYDNIIPLEEIKEDDGIFLCYVAKALAIIEKMNLEKGDYVSIIGGSPVMNILSQLILYYQGIPILIANDNDMLEKAQENGVYYTIDAITDSPYEKVMSITGGRLSEHSVFLASELTSPNYMFDLIQNDGSVIIMGEEESISRIEVDISAIYKKGLKVLGITDYHTKIDGALNTLMQGILKLNNLSDKNIDISSIEDVEELFKAISTNPNSFYCPIINI